MSTTKLLTHWQICQRPGWANPHNPYDNRIYLLADCQSYESSSRQEGAIPVNIIVYYYSLNDVEAVEKTWKEVSP